MSCFVYHPFTAYITAAASVFGVFIKLGVDASSRAGVVLLKFN